MTKIMEGKFTGTKVYWNE